MQNIQLKLTPGGKIINPLTNKEIDIGSESFKYIQDTFNITNLNEIKKELNQKIITQIFISTDSPTNTDCCICGNKLTSKRCHVYLGSNDNPRIKLERILTSNHSYFCSGRYMTTFSIKKNKIRGIRHSILQYVLRRDVDTHFTEFQTQDFYFERRVYFQNSSP